VCFKITKNQAFPESKAYTACTYIYDDDDDDDEDGGGDSGKISALVLLWMCSE
jgi:hypothetical protein